MAKIINPTTIAGEANLGTKTITANGEYFADQDGLDGYSSVAVEVPEPVIIPAKTITENGGYEASEEGAAGYASVSVDVQPNVGTKTITENGTYSAGSEGLDGYSSVHVEVPPTLFRKMADRSITNVTADDLAGVTSIGDYAFYACSNLTSVTLPQTCTTLGESAFANSGIAGLSFPSALKTLGSRCFMRSKIQQVKIPATITTMSGSYMFSGCVDLVSVEFEPSTRNPHGQNIFDGCSALTNVKLPQGMRQIPWQMFIGCSSLQKLVIPNTVANIQAGAFANCSNMTCFVLTRSELTTLDGTNDFSGNPTNIYCPVPETYKVATNWSALASRIFPLVATVSDLVNLDTTTYTKACVIGSDESYKEYTYDGSQWNEVV